MLFITSFVALFAIIFAVLGIAAMAASSYVCDLMCVLGASALTGAFVLGLALAVLVVMDHRHGGDLKIVPLVHRQRSSSQLQPLISAI